MANPDISQYGVATRFKPGVSGNKKGRPRGSLNMSTIVKQLLNDEEFADKVMLQKPTYWRHLPSKNFATAIIMTMMIKALKGDVRAATWLRITGYGNKVEAGQTERLMKPVSVYDMRVDRD